MSCAMRTFASVLSLAVCAAIWLHRGDPPSRPALAPASGPGFNRVPANPAEPKSREISFHPREKHRYAYAFERKIVLHGLTESDPQIAYHGELRLDVLHSDANGFDAIAGARITERRDLDPIALRIHVDSSGRSLDIFGSDTGTERDRQQVAMLKDLLANWVFPLRADTVGRFEARFDTLPDDGDLIRLKKAKLNYIDLSKPAPEVLTSAHLLLWDPALAVPREIRGEESTRLGRGRTAPSSDSSYLIRFVQESEIADPPQPVTAALSVPEPLEISRSEGRMRYRLADASLDPAQVMAQLRGLENLSSAAQLKAFGDLVALLRSSPELIPELVALLQSQDAFRQGAQSTIFKTVVGALASAGTPQAQTAVLKIYQDPDCSPSGKGTILAALTTTQAQLAPSTRQFLASTMINETDPDLSNGAGFALGSSLRNAPDDPQTDQEIRTIRDLWSAQSGADPAEELALLDVMGNSGRPEYFPLIRDLIDGGESAALRAKAVFALRFMPADDAVQLLKRSLNDPAPQIRAAAASAMGLAAWNESFRVPLQSCVASETLQRIQIACQGALRRAPDQVAESP